MSCEEHSMCQVSAGEVRRYDRDLDGLRPQGGEVGGGILYAVVTTGPAKKTGAAF